MLVGLVLELGHPVQLAEARHGAQQPSRLGVRGDVALREDGRALGVEPGREQHRREVERLLAEIVRVVLDADRVEVDDAEEALAALLRRRVLAEAADQVAEVLVARGLDAGKDAHLCSICTRFRRKGHDYDYMAGGYRRLPRAPDRHGRAGVLRAGGRGRRAARGGGRERARQPWPRRDGDRGDRRAGAARDAAARGLPGRRAGAADPEAVQARLAGAPARPDRDRSPRAADRRPVLRLHRRPVHGRDARADARDGPGRPRRGRDDAPRRRLQAAHLARTRSRVSASRRSRSSPRRATRPGCRSSPS